MSEFSVDLLRVYYGEYPCICVLSVCYLSLIFSSSSSSLQIDCFPIMKCFVGCPTEMLVLESRLPQVTISLSESGHSLLRTTSTSATSPFEMSRNSSTPFNDDNHTRSISALCSVTNRRITRQSRQSSSSPWSVS